MFKDKGYDEFWAEKIRIGREQARARQGVSLEVAKQRTKEKLERKIQEMELSRNRDVIYG